ncbi:MAG: Crp/Fnr family transcriptional regulator [Bacteroidota bacterium]
MTIESFIERNLPGYQNANVILPFAVERKSLYKHEIITDYGQVENKIMLLHEGVVQIGTLKGEEERILEFVFAGDFFGAYTSFLLQVPSEVRVMTLNACSLSIIRRDDLLRSGQVSLLSSHLSLYIAQQLFLSRARREKDFLTLSAEERYKKLFEMNPEVIKLIPGNKIASYLGIRPESLSRLRKAIIP